MAAPPTESSYLRAVSERVVIFDGAMGTNLQMAELTADDFGGPDLEGCNELLVITRPDVVEQVHRSFYAVGCDVVETDTFGAFAPVLAEYGQGHRVRELNLAAVALARNAAEEFSTVDRPRWVAGSIGPGTKFPTLGQIRYADLRDAYEEQSEALVEGGADLIVIETVFDLLQAKAAVNGARRAMARAGVRLPIQCQVTIELTGTMLPGTEVGAALVALQAMDVDIIGLNCATGPSEMFEPLRHLTGHATIPVSCLPNAGLPSVVDGAMHYDLEPDQLAEFHRQFVGELGVSVIGGCCGTTPAHLAAVVGACADLTPADRRPDRDEGAASIYTHVPFTQDSSFLVIGERTNANGSKKFREAMLDADWDTCVAMAREQVKEGSHLIDVCVDYTGADGVADMDQVMSRFATQSTAPLMVDSTEAPVVETALSWIGGRAVINSVNLEEGDGAGTRLDSFLTLAKEFGAAVVCTCIDTEGQARTAEWKVRAARAIHDIATQRYGLRPEDLLIDALALPLSTGMEESRRDGIETIEGIRRIKAELPGVYTVLGLSNVSFGLNPAARQVLNSVFLHECVEAGLDAAIVHTSKILPLAKIDERARQVCLDLVYDRRSEGYDPLTELLTIFEGVSASSVASGEDRSGWSVEQRLEHRIIDGDRNGIEADLDEAMDQGLTPLIIINEFLLAGMKTVGELFASGEMQLPFVLGSAETMKTAVAYLEPFMEKADQGGKGTMVLATVKGDVHDIGKNLVDIILTNNGYTVRNLGIKIGINEMAAAVEEFGADAIGMSGLLVKSTLIMRENLEELNRRGLAHIPVILGGAALTRTYVERDLRQVYDGRLFYGKDAFEGLRTMDRLVELARNGEDDPDFGTVIGGRDLGPRKSELRRQAAEEARARGESPRSVHPMWPGTTRCSPRPSWAPGWPRAWPSTTSPPTSTRRPCSGTSGASDPRVARTTRPSRSGSGPCCREQLSTAKAGRLLVPQVAWGHFAANADGDDLVIFTDETRSAERMRFTFPRQVEAPYLCIADFFRSVDSGDEDWASFQVVTMGSRVSEEAARLFADDEYQQYLYLHGLGVEMAEALAEYWHRRIREELGFADEDGPTLTGLFRQKYRGGRYSWGYPACPRLEDNAQVVELLGADRIGVEVSEGFQLHPEQSTTAIICHHPQAKYFVA